MTRRRRHRATDTDRRIAAIQRDLAFVEMLGDMMLKARTALDRGEMTEAECEAAFARLRVLEDLYDARQLPPPAMKS